MLNLYAKRKLMQDERQSNVTGHDSFGPSGMFFGRGNSSKSHFNTRRRRKSHGRVRALRRRRTPDSEEELESLQNHSPASDKQSDTDFTLQTSLLDSGINWLRNRFQTLMSSGPGPSSLMNGLLNFVAPR